jgi:hypothetical protein
MMIALSYPKRFAVNGGTGTVAARAPMPGDEDDDVVVGRTIPVTIGGFDGYGSGYGYYGRGYYSPFGYGYGSSYGLGGAYGGYGGYGYGYYPVGGPVIIVRDPNAGSSPSTHGRMVNGRGYERPRDPSAQGTARTMGADGSSGSSASSGSSSTSSSPSSSSGTTSTGRTAHEKP